MEGQGTAGSVFFEFGRFDKDPRPNHVIDEVRRYTQLIDQRYPYFLYFLPERPEFQQVYSWLASLATPTSPIAANAKGISVDPAAFATLAVARIHAIRSFCERILDDPADTEEGILAALPKQIAAEVRALVSRSA